MSQAFELLTFQDLQNEAQHAIAGPPDPNAPLSRIVNDALEYLVHCHDWTWRTVISTLDFLTGVGQITLPTDFGQLIDLVGFQAKYTAVKPANWRDIVRVRVHGVPDQQILIYHVGAGGQYQVQNPIAGPTLTAANIGGGVLAAGTYYVAQTWLGAGGGETANGPEVAVTVGAGQNAFTVQPGAAPSGAANANVYVGTVTGKEQLSGSVAGGGTYNVLSLPVSTQPFPNRSNTTFDPTQVPTRLLEVAPLPSIQLSQALYLTYRRLVPKLVNLTDVAAVPYGMFGLLKALVRACAYSSTVQQQGHDWQLFNAMLPAYQASDGLAQGGPGKLIDALQEDDGLYATQPWTSIKTPYDP